MYAGDGFGRALQHMCGPKRTGEVEAFSLQFGGHGSIENMQAGEVELVERFHRSASPRTLDRSVRLARGRGPIF